MMLLVTSGIPGTTRKWFSEVLFLVITVGPWVVMVWLLWPGW
jgi:hypothetical protein